MAKYSAPTTRSLTKYEVIALLYLMIEQGAFQTLPSHFQYQKGIYALVEYHLSF